MMKEVWLVEDITMKAVVGIFTTRDLAIEASSKILSSKETLSKIEMRLIVLDQVIS